MGNRVEVHSHTDYSNLRLIDSRNKVKDLIDRAVEIGLKGIAITDHETLAAHVQAELLGTEIKKTNPDFKVMLGNEIYLTDTRNPGQQYYHFILIAKDAIGHKQLRKLSSISWLNSYVDRGMERVPTLKSELAEMVKADPGHLIATSACLGGELSKTTLELINSRKIGDEATEARAYAQIDNFLSEMKALFGSDFYIEIAPGKSREQVLVNEKLKQLSEVYNMKIVIGSDAHYLKKEDRYVHKAFLNSKSSKEREVDDFYEFAYLQDDEDILKNLGDSFTKEEIAQFYDNSGEIYDKVQAYELTHSQQIPKVEVKKYDKSQSLKEIEDIAPTLNKLMESDIPQDRFWVNECVNKLKEKHLFNTEYIERLEEEARVHDVIGQQLHTNMFSYPVTLKHYVDMFWECGSMVGAGRGSSCAGLNHYLLGITQLDPIKWNLPFWRLNQRNSLPM